MRLKGPCILALLLNTLFFFPQGNNAAALELYNKEKTEVKKFCYLDSVQMFAHGKKAIEILKQNNLFYLEAEIRLYFANFFFFQTDYKRAAKFYSEAEAIATKYNNDTLKNIVRVKFAFIEHELGNWSASRKIYDEVIVSA